MAKQIKVTQVRGVSGMTHRQIETVRSLGLKRIRHSVVHKDTPDIRGKAKRVNHLVSLEEV